MVTPNNSDNTRMFVDSPEAFNAAIDAATAAGRIARRALPPLDLDDCLRFFSSFVEGRFDTAQFELSQAATALLAVTDFALDAAREKNILPCFDLSGFGGGRGFATLWAEPLEAGALHLDASDETQGETDGSLLLFLHAHLTDALARRDLAFYSRLHFALNFDWNPTGPLDWHSPATRADVETAWAALLECEAPFVARFASSGLCFDDVWSELMARFDDEEAPSAPEVR